MKNKSLEIKNRAEKIARENSIIILSEEKEILEKLQEISSGNGDNIELKEKTLEDIERYLFVKEKMKFAEKDLKFLRELSKSLREQETRLSDTGNPILFKINNALGNEMFFLTRENLNKYLDVNKDQTRNIIEILSGNSEELVELLECVKRNF